MFLRAYGLLCLIFMSLPVSAQQPNQPEASLILAGLNGPVWPKALPINTALPGATLDIEVSGAASVPFSVTIAGAGLVTPGLSTPFGLLDQDFSAGFAPILDGIGFFPANFWSTFSNTGSTGNFLLSIPLSPASPAFLGGVQGILADPTSPSGFRLSGAYAVSVANDPGDVIYVSATQGAPGNPGSPTAPLDSLSSALAMAAGTAGAPEIWMEVGTYSEPNGLSLVDGVNVRGGFEGTLWIPQVGNLSTIDLGSASARAEQFSQATEFAQLELVTGNANSSGGAAIALILDDCAGFVSLKDCVLTAGNGVDGSNGFNRADSSDGSSGGNASGTTGGSGGNGGISGGRGGNGASGFPAGPGEDAPSVCGVSGGSGGSAGSCGGDAGNGSGGLTGANGAGGSSGLVTNYGGFINSMGDWMPGQGTSGANGGHGCGGRGGGGGGSAPVLFGFCLAINEGGSGGGGGGGGFRGVGGGGASNGGASFALYLDQSSPMIEGCTLTSGNGGAGGIGGRGGEGGRGGFGGSVSNGESSGGGSGGNGGSGGIGGNGGGGGGGAGGHGGPSYCVYKVGGSTPAFIGSNALAPGLGGLGGQGGVGGDGGHRAGVTTPAPDGSDGQAGLNGQSGMSN